MRGRPATPDRRRDPFWRPDGGRAPPRRVRAHLDPARARNLVPIAALERQLRHRWATAASCTARSAKRCTNGWPRERRSRRSCARIRAHDDRGVPRRPGGRRVPPTRRSDRRPHGGPEGRGGSDLRGHHRGRGRLRGSAVRIGYAPDRRARHHAGGQGANGSGRRRARRSRGVGVGRPRRGGRARDRRGTPQGPVRRRDGAAVADRARPGRRPRPRGPGLLRWSQGRPHVHQRDLGRSHQDLVRAVLPPDADLDPRGCGLRRGEPPRPRVQRQGRGPAVARSAERIVRGPRGSPRRLDGARRRPRSFPQRSLLGAAATPER